jgi:hypothetical protein
MSLITELQAVRDEHGRLDAELVADVAADPAHPLHSHVYDCPPEVASRRYYVSRAAQLLRVTFNPDPAKPTHLRAFVAVKGEDTTRSDYVPSDEAFADPLLAAMVLRSMEREAKAFAARYRHHKAYAATVQNFLLGDAS